MLIAPNDDLTAHAVSVNAPTAENPDGYHRLIGGSVQLGEFHRDAIVREVHEELGAAIQKLDFLATVDNVFRMDGSLGHEVVFLYSGRLEPPPVTANATLTESDGSVVPVVWRSFHEPDESLPLYPTAAVGWVRLLLGANARTGGGPPESLRAAPTRD